MGTGIIVRNNCKKINTLALLYMYISYTLGGSEIIRGYLRTILVHVEVVHTIIPFKFSLNSTPPPRSYQHG